MTVDDLAVDLSSLERGGFVRRESSSDGVDRYTVVRGLERRPRLVLSELQGALRCAVLIGRGIVKRGTAPLCRVWRILVLLFCYSCASAQLIGANDEAVRHRDDGGLEHDGTPRETLLRATTPSAAMTYAAPSWLPRPYVFVGLSLNGGGYQALSPGVGGGMLLRADKLWGEFGASYENSRKTNDGTIDNRRGRSRYLSGRLFYPWRRSLYFGGGAQWNQLSTTNYKKSSWRPAFGVGGDRLLDISTVRWQVMYITPGSDRSNALQGPEFQFWVPSPASRSHFIFRMSLGWYFFHMTVTDPSDRRLTAQQTADRYHTVFGGFRFGWRF